MKRALKSAQGSHGGAPRSMERTTDHAMVRCRGLGQILDKVVSTGSVTVRSTLHGLCNLPYKDPSSETMILHLEKLSKGLHKTLPMACGEFQDPGKGPWWVP